MLFEILYKGGWICCRRAGITLTQRVDFVQAGGPMLDQFAEDVVGFTVIVQL